MVCVVVSLVALLSAPAVLGCLVPPNGCTEARCKGYEFQVVPKGNGQENLDLGASWGAYQKLAFIRSKFNPSLFPGQLGPGKFTNASWYSLYTKGYGSPLVKPANVPALQYEAYRIEQQYVLKSYSTTLKSCCNDCRVTDGCNLYFFYAFAQNSKRQVGKGTCLQLKGGSVPKDGPFTYRKEGDRFSPRDKNLGTPYALPRCDASKKVTKACQTNFDGEPTAVYGFLGGYCNGNPGVVNDPHFTGAHGTRFDFNGELDKAFCLLTDKSLHLNAVLKGYKADNAAVATQEADSKTLRSWIKEIGLIWTDAEGKTHNLHLVARSGKETARGDGFLAAARLDGSAVAVPKTAGSSLNVGDLTLTFLGVGKKGWYEVDRYQVVIGDQLDMSFNMRVAHPKLQAPDDAEVHFNLMFNDIKATENIHGVLGQTYRNTPEQVMKAVKYSQLSSILGSPVRADGKSGAGFLEGSVSDYESSHVLKPDCKVSAFSYE